MIIFHFGFRIRRPPGRQEGIDEGVWQCGSAPYLVQVMKSNALKRSKPLLLSGENPLRDAPRRKPLKSKACQGRKETSAVNDHFHQSSQQTSSHIFSELARIHKTTAS